MKKVFLVHGFEGSPNGGWRPWLMGALEKKEIYACALAMPNPDRPVVGEWVEEIDRHVRRGLDDEVYLVGHSLGVLAILRYLETKDSRKVAGAVLVSGPAEKNTNRAIDNFLEASFGFAAIKKKCGKFAVIHGDNDPFVPISHAQTLARELNGELIIIPGGGHLNGSAGWFSLPQCLKALEKMMGLERS